jgi:hypothetical protein
VIDEINNTEDKNLKNTLLETFDKYSNIKTLVAEDEMRYILRNEILEKALEGTWRNKEKFYENTKGLSMLEIITKIENTYKECGSEQNRTVTAPRTAVTDSFSKERHPQEL